MLSQRQIGKLLSASHNQLTALLGRLKKQGAAEPVKSWIRDWLDAEAGKAHVSIDGV